MGKANTAVLEMDHVEEFAGPEPGTQAPTQDYGPKGWELKKTDVRIGNNEHGFKGDIFLTLHRDRLGSVVGTNDGLLPELLAEIRATSEYKSFANIQALVAERTNELEEVIKEGISIAQKIAELQPKLGEPNAMDKMRELFFAKSGSTKNSEELANELRMVETTRDTARAKLVDVCINLSAVFKNRVAAQRQEALLETEEAFVAAISPVLDRLFAATRASQRMSGWAVSADDLMQKLESQS